MTIDDFIIMLSFQQYLRKKLHDNYYRLPHSSPDSCKEILQEKKLSLNLFTPTCKNLNNTLQTLKMT